MQQPPTRSAHLTTPPSYTEDGGDAQYAVCAARPHRERRRLRAYRPARYRWTTALLWLLLLATSTSAKASDPRDAMFSIPDDGTQLLVDYFLTGAQLSIRHNRNLFGKANSLRLTGSGVLSYPLGQAEGRIDLRALAFEFSVSAGYRSVFRSLTFDAGKDGEYCADCSRRARRRLDPLLSASPSTSAFAFAEGRINLLLPFNDFLVGTAHWALRYEGRQPRSYDWVHTDIHDGGLFQRFEASLFAKHRDYGAIAPYVQMLRLRQGDRLRTAWAVGLNMVTRPGIVRHDDVLLITLLVRPSDPFYGQHSYFAPIRALVAYRLQFLL